MHKVSKSLVVNRKVLSAKPVRGAIRIDFELSGLLVDSASAQICQIWPRTGGGESLRCKFADDAKLTFCATAFPRANVLLIQVHRKHIMFEEAKAFLSLVGEIVSFR